MAATTTLEGARVLIVEDEFFIADDLARALRQKGGEPVGPASTIQQAEDLITREHLDAAILDLNLRGEMASRLIARLAEARLPCLIVSGYSEDAMPESISGVARLEKPISPSSVMETLAAQLRRAGQAAAGRAPVRSASAHDEDDAGRESLQTQPAGPRPRRSGVRDS